MARVSNGVRGPAARSRSSRAARSPGSPTASSSSGSSPARSGRRGRLRRAGGPARADGAGRLPAAPGRRPACRGRLPGRLPRPGPEGPVDPRPRPAGQLALRRRDPDGAVREAAARPPAQAGGGQRHERPWSRLVAPAEPTAPPADRPAIDREQAEALHGEIDRLPRAFRLPVVLCYFEGLTLDEAARRLRCPAGTLRSRLARAREKLRRRPDAPRRRLARRRARRGPGAPVRLGVRLIPSCAIPPPGPRSPSRPVTPPPAGRSPRPPRHWPRRSCGPC